MANIKPFLSILSTAPLLLISLPSMAEDENQVELMPVTSMTENEDTVESNLIKSPFSLDFVGLQSDYYSSSGGRLGLGYQPYEDSGIVTNLSLEHFTDLTYKLSDTEFESEFTNLRWSAGYKLDVTNDFNITPSLGVVTDISNFSANTTQGYTNLRFAYDITDSFSLFIESTYDFGSAVLPDTGNFGIGFKYTPHYSQPVVSLVDDEPSPLLTPEPALTDFNEDAPILNENSSVTGVVDNVELGDELEIVEEDIVEEVAIIEDVVESNTFVAIGTFYAVQLGSFRYLSSADPIINKMQVLNKKTFIKQSGELTKLYTGKFQSNSEAQAEVRKLKANNINGFVTKIN